VVNVNGPTVDINGNPYDRTYIINNTAGNNFDFNEYHNLTSGRAAFKWVADANRTFAQWQSDILQDGVGPGQDINSSRSDT
jgi:hypothetical protein